MSMSSVTLNKMVPGTWHAISSLTLIYFVKARFYLDLLSDLKKAKCALSQLAKKFLYIFQSVWHHAR